MFFAFLFRKFILVRSIKNGNIITSSSRSVEPPVNSVAIEKIQLLVAFVHRLLIDRRGAVGVVVLVHLIISPFVYGKGGKGT